MVRSSEEISVTVLREPYERETVSSLRKETARRKLRLIKQGPDSNNTKERLIQMLRDYDRGIAQQIGVHRKRRAPDELASDGTAAIHTASSAVPARATVRLDPQSYTLQSPLLLPIPLGPTAPQPIRPRPLVPGGRPLAVAITPSPTASNSPHSSVDYSMAEVMTSLLKRRRTDETDEEQLDHAIKALDMISRALVSVNSVIANLRDEIVHTTENSDEQLCMLDTLAHFKRVRMEFLKETQHFTWVSNHAMAHSLQTPPNPQDANRERPAPGRPS
ncbi:hypothetical protein ACHHYP_11087 [Achlya hypogyna]|uniref:Uncharacterized protein n=1 Tax=Achlya hypogyna TaxID=1202772 RepID=A0A1V9YK19_ACHHY|nr:hypothetical protein ACHHYP_11087 [Achlya hypogyna]